MRQCKREYVPRTTRWAFVCTQYNQVNLSTGSVHQGQHGYVLCYIGRVLHEHSPRRTTCKTNNVKMGDTCVIHCA